MTSVFEDRHRYMPPAWLALLSVTYFSLTNTVTNTLIYACRTFRH